MQQSIGPLKLWYGAQTSFEFFREDEHAVEFVCDTLQGYGLFRRKERGGSYTYWTTEEPTGKLVFDERTSNPLTMFEAMDALGVGKQMWQYIGETLGYNR